MPVPHDVLHVIILQSAGSQVENLSFFNFNKLIGPPKNRVFSK